MSATFRRTTIAAAIAVALGVFGGAPKAIAVTTFLNHFDIPDPIYGSGGAGTADYAVGNPLEQISPPLGPGGTIVPGGKFGNAIDRSTGGRVEYQTAGNYDVNKGTIEMWVKGDGVTGGGFVGLWGTDTGSGSGDIRMYIYDTGAGRTLGAYQLGAGGTFWECEQAIPLNLLDNTNWHSVAWAFDTNAGVTATWWDGQLLRNTPDSGTVNPRTSFTGTLFHIGENQTGSATFPGLIDEFRISNQVVYNTNNSYTPQTAPFPAPEPASVALLVLGGALIGLRRWEENSRMWPWKPSIVVSGYRACPKLPMGRGTSGAGTSSNRA